MGFGSFAVLGCKDLWNNANHLAKWYGHVMQSLELRSLCVSLKIIAPLTTLVSQSDSSIQRPCSIKPFNAHPWIIPYMYMCLCCIYLKLNLYCPLTLPISVSLHIFVYWPLYAIHKYTIFKKIWLFAGLSSKFNRTTHVESGQTRPGQVWASF